MSLEQIPTGPSVSLAQTLSCSPESMGRKSATSERRYLGSSWGFPLCPLPRSHLEAQSPLPLPHLRELEFVLVWGMEKEHPHFILTERDALGS